MSTTTLQSSGGQPFGAHGSQPGWYDNPTGAPAYRMWTGHSWSQWVSNGTAVWADPLCGRRHVRPSDIGHLQFVADVVVPEARDRCASAPIGDAWLTELLGDLYAEASGNAPAGPFASAETTPTVWDRVTAGRLPVERVPADGVPLPEAPTAPPREPLALMLWWQRVRAAVGSDLALHGLAYLGVLLFFVGVFGLLVFAFGDVAPALRPVAELAIAATPLGAAALLGRRAALIVGRALEVVGGMLLPVAVMATLLDGVAVPPDPNGASLVVALTAVCAAVGVAYLVWCRRHPDSGLRYLLAPMAVLTVGMATLGVGRAIPSGKDVAVPTSGQVAAMAGALTVALVAARWRPRGRLSASTLTAGPPAVPVLALLTLLTAGADGWPALPVLLSGVLLLVGLDTLAVSVPGAVLGVVEPVWWAAVTLALAPGLGAAQAGALAVVGFAVVLERGAAARRPSWTALLPVAGALIALGITSTSPWWAFGTAAAVSGWALVRRLVPLRLPGAARSADVATGVLPLWALAALAAATEVPVALAAGAGLVLAAGVPATRPVLRRGSRDRFWTGWWSGALIVVLSGTAAAWAGEPSGASAWLVVAAVGALALACAVGPIVAIWRPWAVLVLAGYAWLAACEVAALPATAQGVVMALAGFVVVAVAHARRVVADPALAGSLGVAGHACALAALGAAGSAWGLVTVVGLATVGWLLTTVRDVDDGSPVAGVFARLGGAAGRFVPPVLAAAGLPVTVRLALAQSGALPLHAVWEPAVLAGTALGYAAAARLPVRPQWAVTLAWTAFVSGVGAGVLATEPGPGAVGFASLIGAVVILPGARRAVPMIWAAWAAVAPLAADLALARSRWFAELAPETAAATTLTVVGGALLVGGAAADVLRGGWSARLAPRLAALRPLLVIGGIEVGAALAIALVALSGVTEARVILAVAAVCFVTGLLARAGAVTGAGALLGWLALVLLAPGVLDHAPWLACAAAAGLLGAAEALHRAVADREWWSRWDLPPLMVAAPVAVTGLIGAADGDWYVATFVLTGVELLAVAARLWQKRAMAALLTPAGVALILFGAAEAGTGWLALALVALCAALAVAANESHGGRRLLCQAAAVAAALGAWASGLSWLAWSAQRSIDTTAVAAGAALLAASVAARTTRVARSWLLTVSATSLVVTGAVAVAAERALWAPTSVFASVAPSGWVTTGLGLAALALFIGAEPLHIAALRELGAATAAAAVGVVLQTYRVDAGGRVAVWVATSVLCTGAIVLLARSDRATLWRRPNLVLGATALVAALWTAALQLPDRSLLVPSLAAASLLAGITGLVLRSSGLQVLSPLLACAAWLTYASVALTGNPQWFTVPLGLASILVASVWRHDRAVRALPRPAPPVIAVEIIGIAFLVGASFVQSLTESIGYALIAAGFGVGVAAWGVVTEVRRRLAAGVVIVLAAVVVLVAVPLSRVLPAWEGAGLWILVAVIGLAAVLGATLLEQGRAAAGRSLKRIKDATSGWE